MAVRASALLGASLARLPAFAVLQIAVLLAIADNVLLR